MLTNIEKLCTNSSWRTLMK
uniref:Uncharacterized protein n=1 Tax=Arundo donax TaxID=35708 RepID=A0A0A9AB10_ARUDO